MPNKNLKKNSIKRLFLICPTDRMEQLIVNHFRGEVYFYTALGAYFEFDLRVQSKLWDLIGEYRIEQVIFVTAINNVFYKQVFDKNEKHNYPIDEILAETKKEISKHRIHPEVFSSNLHLLAARHLKNQKQRLLSTRFLGNRLREKNIIVDAYAYQPEKKIFSSYREIEKMGCLLKSISYN